MVFTCTDLTLLAHLVNMRMNEGQTREEIKMAKRKWRHQEVLALTTQVILEWGHPEEVARQVADHVWHALGVIDDNRRGAGRTEFYRDMA
jgi:hypothetical protein